MGENPDHPMEMSREAAGLYGSYITRHGVIGVKMNVLLDYVSRAGIRQAKEADPRIRWVMYWFKPQ